MNNTENIEFPGLVDNRSLVDKVETHLLEFFNEKKFSPGDVIPKELELAKAMGVSRTVIRESLNRLKTLGIIEAVKHKGTIIKSPDIPGLLGKSLIPQILDDSTLKDIFEIRLVVEIGMADLLYRNITSDDIKDLEEIVKIEPEKSDDVLFDKKHEILFHGKLYEITKNDTLKQFQQLLFPIFDYIYISGLIKKPIKRKKHVSHYELVKVLKNGTPDDFRVAMRNHLENHFQRIMQ